MAALLLILLVLILLFGGVGLFVAGLKILLIALLALLIWAVIAGGSYYRGHH
ncbi:MAG: hypothetical protein ACM3S1_07980 [Hyphomicrobiales bacterium]